MITIQFKEDGSFDITGISQTKKRNLMAQKDFKIQIESTRWWIEHCQE